MLRNGETYMLDRADGKTAVLGPGVQSTDTTLDLALEVGSLPGHLL